MTNELWFFDGDFFSDNLIFLKITQWRFFFSANNK